MTTGNTSIWLGKTVPRYTSYPPAPFFEDGVTAIRYAHALASIPIGTAVSLYIHIPFCHSLCLYCGCHTRATHSHDIIADYITALEQEMALIAATVGRCLPISHLHFGGGTPNLLNADDMERIFTALHQCFDFSNCREIAMELDPRQITYAQPAVLAAHGINRVSLGVQDFDLAVQAAVQRIQPYEMVAQAVDGLRQAGIANFNFDLMYGLPFQNPETMTDTAEKVLALRPDRISLFSYAHVPQVKRHQQTLEHYGLPQPQESLVLEAAARQVLEAAGYIPIGMDHFALPRDGLTTAWEQRSLRRNFQGYTDDAAINLLGLGASSIGFVGNTFFQNKKETVTYQSHIVNGGFATSRGKSLSADDIVRAAIIERLMCYMECDLAQVCQAHGLDPAIFTLEMQELLLLVTDGIISVEGYIIRLVCSHRMAIRMVCRVFDRYTAATTVSSRIA